MEFNEDVSLDTSQVEDIRASGGGSGGRVALGGGGLGIVGLLIYFLISQIGGGGGGLAGGLAPLDNVGSGQQVDNTNLSSQCKTGKDANSSEDCRLVAVINSIQAYWTDEFARSGSTYQPAKTRFFRGSVQTGCGGATSDSGPFYCPADKYAYIDLTFFDELASRFGAQNTGFVQAYVLAHEYGHHVQNLLGTSNKVRTRQGPASDSVKLELQADCFAGVWAKHATTQPVAGGKPLIKSISQEDIDNALDAAGRIGDDFIQKKLGNGQVDTSQFSHGSSAQRQKWFTTGIQTGAPSACDTFRAGNLG